MSDLKVVFWFFLLLIVWLIVEVVVQIVIDISFVVVVCVGECFEFEVLECGMSFFVWIDDESFVEWSEV